MAIDRRARAAKTYAERKKKEEQEKARRAVQAAVRRDLDKAQKAQKTKEGAKRSLGKNITTSVRDTFRQQAAKPQFGRGQTAAQRMQGRSENWARLEAQKAGADKATRKKIETAQDQLHKANRKDAKGMTFDRAAGQWMRDGKPAYTPLVLPGMSRDAQRAGTERSLRSGVVAPDMQKAAQTHQDAVWDRVHGPETGERVQKTLSGAAKGYGSDMENFHGLAITGRGMGMEEEHAREIKVWEDEIRQWEKSLRDWEADGSLTDDERKELTDLIAANRKKIEMYEKLDRGTRAASQEVYETADKLDESAARELETAKKGLGAFGSAAVDVGAAGAQMLGDMALGGTTAMLMRGVGGGAKEARQAGADHAQQVNYGILSGAASVLTEKISNVAKPLSKAFGKGAADDLIQKGIDKAVKKLAGSAAGEKALQTIAKHGANALGEGFEESLEAALDPLWKRATYDGDAQWDLGEIIYNGIIGAGTGLVAGSGTEAVQSAANAALSLPGRSARKPELTIAYGKPGETPPSAPQTPPLTGEARAAAAQGGKPELVNIEKPKTLNDRIRENIDLFEKNGILFEMTGNEFAQSDKKLIDQVTEFFNSIGNKVFRKNFGEVTLTRSGARDSISHGTGREKAIAFAAVPDVIQKGQVIDEQVNWKGRRYDTVTFGGRIKIAGQDYDMGVIVKRYDNPAMASKYYVHEVMLANKEGEATTFKTGTEPAEPVGYPSDVTSPSTDSIPQTAGKSKPQLTMEYGKPGETPPPPAAAPPLSGEARAETTIDTNPETHTPEQMAQIQEYVDSADDGLLDFAKTYEENPNAKFGRYTISPVSQRQASDISKVLGIDVSGYRNAINKSGVNHILRRHGANGEADHSMAELGDLSRMGYVIDHYDTVQALTDQNGEPVTSTEFRGADNAPAPMVRFAKKIDGTYYVVEAVADNRYKKLWVVSAYMDKSSPVTQVLDAVKTAPSSQSSETPLASPESALNQSIPQTAGESKPELTIRVSNRAAKGSRKKRKE